METRVNPFEDAEFRNAGRFYMDLYSNFQMEAMRSRLNLYSEDNPQPIDAYGQSALDGGQLDNRYYTETELDAVAIERTVQLSATTLTLTWDATTNTLDLTSQTSASARWAYISVWWRRAGDSTDDFLWYYYDDDANPIITLSSDNIGSSNYRQGSAMTVPLDSEQRVKYNAPANTTTRLVVLYGYKELLTLEDLIS